MTWKIPLFKIYWDEEDVNKVSEAVRAGMYWAEGPNIPEFEEKILEYIGSKYCVVFNSGTSALHAALIAHGIDEGDEVIVPSFTFISTANAPLFVNAKPVFADIEEETLGLDPEDVNEKITNKTRAIIPVHYGGCPCKIRELKEIAEDNKLVLIDDAAEAFGASVDNKRIGLFGDSTMFSFCQNKIITTGDGGAITTDSRETYEKLKLIRSHGRSTSDYFSSTGVGDYISLGYNFRMSNITASLGVSQVKKADEIIKMRKERARYLVDGLRDVQEITLPTSPLGYEHIFQFFTIKTSERDELMKYLVDKGIMTKIYFPPVHSTHFYRDNLGYTCQLPVTDLVSNQALSLPMYPTLIFEEMDYIIKNIKIFFGD